MEFAGNRAAARDRNDFTVGKSNWRACKLMAAQANSITIERSKIRFAGDQYQRENCLLRAKAYAAGCFAKCEVGRRWVRRRGVPAGPVGAALSTRRDFREQVFDLRRYRACLDGRAGPLIPSGPLII